MKNNYQKPPDWWSFSTQAWEELIGFFSAEEIILQSNWQELTLGQSNYNFQLCTGSNSDCNKYFIQIINAKNQELLPKVKRPPILQRLDQYPRLKPWLVNSYINTSHVRVFAWFDTSLVSTVIFTDSLISSLTAFLIQLHSEKITSNSSASLPVIDITQHLDRYRKLAIDKSPEESKQIGTIYQKAALLTQTFVADRLCHNDLSPNNLLWDARHSILKVIDWEYACYSDPVMDIAGLITSCKLSEQQQKYLLDGYLEQIDLKVSTTELFKKLSKMKQLSQHISSLWQFANQPKN